MTLPQPYQGSSDYVFISYAHEDAGPVYEDLAALEQAGIHFWYDGGIDPGAHWREKIATRVTNAAGLLCFLSARSLESQYCRQELLFAVDEGKPVVVIFLEDVELPPVMRMTMRERQSIIRAGAEPAGYREKLVSGARSLLPLSAQDPQDHGKTTIPLPATLRLSVGDRVTEVPPSFSGEFTVGRNKDNHCALASSFVSRRHGYFRRAGGSFVYGDRSKNGTLFVEEDGRETLIHGEERRLPRRGALRLGDQLIEYETRFNL